MKNRAAMQQLVKSIIVTPQIPQAYLTGGIGTFVWHFARLLRGAGHDVGILYTEPPQRPSREWMPLYERHKISVQSIRDPDGNIDFPPAYPNQGYHYHTRVSELVAQAIPEDTDIVYFSDWRYNGLHLVRSKRYRADKLPITVSVLHGCTSWHRQGQQLWPTNYDDLGIDYLEQYQVEHSDFAIAPSQHMLDWALANGWRLQEHERCRLLPYPIISDLKQGSRPVRYARQFKRVVFYGRLETRKGLDLFVEALLRLEGKSCLSELEEVVLLGGPGESIYGDPRGGAETRSGNDQRKARNKRISIGQFRQS